MRTGVSYAAAFIAFAIAFLSEVRGQWQTENFNLKAGWTSVYLHIDASYTTLDALVGADETNPIEEIWMWVPEGGAMQFFDDPQQPIASNTNWLHWNRDAAGASALQRLAPNTAYLVRVRSDVPNYTWSIKGQVAPPAYNWTSTGINFLGFATPRVSPPNWETFLGPAEALHNNAEVYRYTGGPFGEGNPARLWQALFRSTPLVRGQAYWVRTETYNRYFGPFQISLQRAGGIHFGAESGQYRIRLTNTTGEPVAVSATLVGSEAPPPGQNPIVGNVPLLLRGEMDLTDLTHGFTRFVDGSAQWMLAPDGEPGSQLEVVLGLERAAMTGSAGDTFAGILRFTDGEGLIEVDLPVTAEVGSTSGLWVGNALIGEVQHALASYAGSGGGDLLQNEDGSYVVEAVDDSFGAVARPFPLRLIVHENGSGATLLQRVYYGYLDADTPVVARREDALNPALLSISRRISAVHLPWSEENVAWPFDGPLNQAAEIEVTVPLSYDDQASNPFLHTYHPDHDNLDARFEQTLPQGVESYGVERRILLRVHQPAEDFASVTSGSGSLSGAYEETVVLHGRGNASREYRSRGAFLLNRVTDLSTLTE